MFTGTQFVLFQAFLDFVPINNRLVTRYASVGADCVIGTGAANTILVTFVTSAIYELIFRLGTFRHTIHTVPHMQTFRTVISIGSRTREFAFRMTLTTFFKIHLVNIRLAMTRTKASAIEFYISTFQTLLSSGSPASS